MVAKCLWSSQGESEVKELVAQLRLIFCDLHGL